MAEIEAIIQFRGRGKPVHLRASAYLWLSIAFICIFCNSLQIFRLARLAGVRRAAP